MTRLLDVTNAFIKINININFITKTLDNKPTVNNFCTILAILSVKRVQETCL